MTSCMILLQLADPFGSAFFQLEVQNCYFYEVLYKFYRKFCDFVGSVMPTIDRSRSSKSPSQGSVGIKSPVSVSGF